MMVAMNVPLPPDLARLVRHYKDKNQVAVRFRVPSWQRALASCSGDMTALLTDDRYSTPCSSGPYRRLGDRTTTRLKVRAACLAMDLNNRDQVLQTFVLVMAWGSGTTGSRALRNTARALSDPNAAYTVLACSARRLRAARSLSEPLQQAHRNFKLAGVRRAFFTKWFSYAGYVPGRKRNPLILDSRVLETLNKTLHVTTRMMADDDRRWAVRCVAYVEHLHGWASELTATGCPVDGERLEWIMFEHNGKPLPPPSETNQPEC